MSNLPDTGAVKAFVFSECKRWNRCYRVSRNEQKKGIMVFVCSSASKYDKQSKCPFKMTFKRHKTMNLWNIVEKSSHYAHARNIADGKRRQFNTKDLVSVDKKVIDRIYMAFGHSKSFFSHRHQRKFVAADMSFLKGAYKGQLGVVSTKDANGKITILAVAFVPTENGKEWVWFMGKVMVDFPTLKITISDRLKGWDDVEESLKSFHVQHTHCILHMKDNALDMARKKKLPGYPGNLQKDIVCAAKITETGRFNKEMEKIYKKCPDIGKFFGLKSGM